MPLQIRRGTNAERLAMTVPLAQGELLYVTDDQRLYIGNSSTLGGVQITGYTNADAQDAASTIFTGNNAHSGINFTYNTSTNLITATVDLSSYSGPVTADALKGSVFADNSTLLVDGVSGTINLNGTVNDDIIPYAFGPDLGSNGIPFNNLYIGGFVKLGSATITSTGTAVNLPAGSTIGGFALGMPGGDLNVNIVADDSTVIVNTATEVVTAQGGFIGNLTGNVVGYHTGDVKGSLVADDSTIMVDAVDRIFYGTIDTGNTVIDTNSLTGNIFSIGTTTSILDTLTLNLNNNLQIQHSINGTNGKFVSLSLRRGSLSSPAAVQAGDELGGFVVSAFSDSSTSAIAGTFGFFVDPTAVIAGGNFIKSKVIISASSDTGAAEADALIVDSAGKVTSNAFVANTYMQLPVYANDAARSSAVTAPVAGMMVFMTSGTSPSVTNKAVIYNGSAWAALPG